MKSFRVVLSSAMGWKTKKFGISAPTKKEAQHQAIELQELVQWAASVSLYDFAEGIEGDLLGRKQRDRKTWNKY
jgi:hypothetical protein